MNRQLSADITDLCADIRSINATAHILAEYATNTELNQSNRLDNIIMALGNVVELLDKLEHTADEVETDAYCNNDDEKNAVQEIFDRIEELRNLSDQG